MKPANRITGALLFPVRVRMVILAAVLAAAVLSPVSAGGGNPEPAPMMEKEMAAVPEGAKTAVLAGGCFWGIEGIYERLNGVVDVVSGYSGGEAATARYNMVGTGKTGHAESVRILYDPSQISYRTLLEVFFSVAHDPTQLDYQGPDHGPQYRSAVFYADEDQKREAEQYIKELTDKKIFKDQIVTEVTPLKEFYPAEDYHQDFMKMNPNQSYIVYYDLPKIQALEKRFPELLAQK